MSIFIVNDTNAEGVGWRLDGLSSAGSATALASGSLGSDAQTRTHAYNPPPSPSYPSFRVSFSPPGASGPTSKTVADQSTVRMGIGTRIAVQTQNACTNQPPVTPSGIKIVNDISSISMYYRLYGQAPSGGARTPIGSGSIPTSGSRSFTPSQLSGYNFFDVVFSNLGSASGGAGMPR
ncbi:hypothetical protein [Breoghania sp. L-A4]|uniref:hypothetical protein n=1 Tax=Breoghania sp. L-A4 TaxID=2304600 RepID=UPI000E35933B|nr:hypothetical protein [Breoghania sp. L-A4]AXS40816.1 hypothetical protein D1F64_13100 [Breoghania sp. L-A4]